MRKTVLVAIREFLATVGTKGFLIGVLIVPLIMVGAIVLIPRLVSDKQPALEGTIEILDRTRWEGSESAPTIGAQLTTAYSPEVLRTELEMMKRGAEAQAKQALGESAGSAAGAAIESQLGPIPNFTIRQIPDDADLEAHKARLHEGGVRDGGLMAIVEIDPNAVRADDTGAFGAYHLYLRPKLDDRTEDPLHNKVREAIRMARIAASGQDAALLARLMTVGRTKSTVVTSTGERDSIGGGATFLLPMGFMMLMWVGVFTGGQYLMTTVIEEKSSRVMEVILSAASPVQIMTGKIIGQMGVALSILVVYAVLGVLALRQFNLLYLLSASQLTLLVVYFIIGFLLIGSLMAAIGSAVSEMREAQALLTPIMLVLIIPMMLWMPIGRNPNGMLATVLSFVPPINPFVMVIRLGGTEHIAAWQIAASIAVGVLGVIGAIWITSKIFRIGVLMYGKPPNFRTLIKWVRMA
ncbi:MAG: ABC transporter permease [Phycisphaeraceae bacterium]|nr:ABC transporter permease [Phycisphaeraceae bacterium]